MGCGSFKRDSACDIAIWQNVGQLRARIAAGSQAAMIIVQSLLTDEFGLPYPTR